MHEECDVITIERRTRPEKLNEVTTEASEAAIAVRKMFPNPPTGSEGVSSSIYEFNLQFTNKVLVWVLLKAVPFNQYKYVFPVCVKRSSF